MAKYDIDSLATAITQFKETADALDWYDTTFTLSTNKSVRAYAFVRAFRWVDRDLRKEYATKLLTPQERREAQDIRETIQLLNGSV